MRKIYILVIVVGALTFVSGAAYFLVSAVTGNKSGSALAPVSQRFGFAHRPEPAEGKLSVGAYYYTYDSKDSLFWQRYLREKLNIQQQPQLGEYSCRDEAVAAAATPTTAARAVKMVAPAAAPTPVVAAPSPQAARPAETALPVASASAAPAAPTPATMVAVAAPADYTVAVAAALAAASTTAVVVVAHPGPPALARPIQPVFRPVTDRLSLPIQARLMSPSAPRSSV